MLLRWLLSVFPRETRLGWQRLASDAFVWCAVAAVLTILPYLEFSVGPAGVAEGVAGVAARVLSAALALLRIAAPPLVFVVAAARFTSLDMEEHRAWRAVGRIARRRTLPALAAWLTSSALALTVSLVAQSAAIAVLSEMQGATPALAPLSAACRIFIYVSLMARFAFVPFIVALERRDDSTERRRKRGKLGASAYWLAWPLVESWGRTRARALRLLPYVFLVIYAPIGAGFVWAALRTPASFLLQLVSFTALAVLFNHYSETSVRPRIVEREAS